MALGLEMKNYVPVLGGASIVVAVITANTVYNSHNIHSGLEQCIHRKCPKFTLSC